MTSHLRTMYAERDILRILGIAYLIALIPMETLAVRDLLLPMDAPPPIAWAAGILSVAPGMALIAIMPLAAILFVAGWGRDL